MQITNEYIDKCLKVFYRFSKESKQFTLLKNYLFFPGRKKEEFYDSVRRMYDEGIYDFGDILHITYTLGKGWEDRNGVVYYETISSISDLFKRYWKKHKI